MEHGLKDIAFYVQKHKAPQVICNNFLLVRDKPLGMPTSVGQVNCSYCPEMVNSEPNWRLLASVTLKLDRWCWKRLRHLFYTPQSFVHHLITMFEFNKTGVIIQKYSNFGKICFHLCDPELRYLNLNSSINIILSMVIILENFMMTQWQEHCRKGMTYR